MTAWIDLIDGEKSVIQSVCRSNAVLSESIVGGASSLRPNGHGTTMHVTAVLPNGAQVPVTRRAPEQQTADERQHQKDRQNGMQHDVGTLLGKVNTKLRAKFPAAQPGFLRHGLAFSGLASRPGSVSPCRSECLRRSGRFELPSES
jgi:hypothetical protein